MLVFAELSGQLFKKMLFSAKILWHHAKHVNISIKAVCFKPETTKDFHAVANLFEINELIFGGLGHINHPFVDDLSKFIDDLSFELAELLRVIIVLSKDIRNCSLVFLILLGVALVVDHLESAFEGLEVLIGG